MKQADQSWGAPTGASEWKDEQAGEAIANEEKTAEPESGGWDSGGVEGGAEWNKTATDAGNVEGGAGDVSATTGAAEASKPSVTPEPEDNSRSYADYLAEQAEKKLALGANPHQVRKPNEGSKQDGKWAEARALNKDDGDNYISGKGAKEKRERQRKEKSYVEVDYRVGEPERGRGGRGGRGRGDFRGGDRGRGGRGRGGDGYRGRGEGGFRGGGRGGGGRDTDSVNVEDESAFPSLKGS